MNERNNKLTRKVSLGKRITNFPQLSIMTAVIALFIIWSILANNFLTPGNIINILRQASTLIIVCIGTTFVLISGGIDLSTGAVVGFTGMVAASMLANYGINITTVVLLSMIMGAVIGLVNGLIITKAGVAPFIMTLASMTTLEGLMLLYCSGRTITGIPDEALFLGRGYLSIFPIPTLIMIAVLAIMWIVLGKTKFGRYVYAIGGNEKCAKLSGIKVNFNKIMVYVLASAICGLVGVILTMRIGSGQVTLGKGIMLDSIAAAVLGGTPLIGGRGSMLGTVLGCIFLITLTNGLNIIGVSSYWQQALTGIVLISAVIFYKK